jgi:hypothetical protein
MMVMNSKKLLASALIFVLSNLVTPVIAAPKAEAEVATTTQETVVVRQAPKMDVGIPRVVNISEQGGADKAVTKGNKVIIRSVQYAPALINDLKACHLSFAQDQVVVMTSGYSNSPAAYVSLATSDLRSGLMQITSPQNILEKNVQNVLAHPEQYHIRGDLINVQLAPKIVTDTQSNSSLLAMESWDFRLVNSPKYSPAALNFMLTNAYSSFKSYAQIVQKQNPGQPIIIHTSFWGTGYQNNPKMTTALQLIAAQLAGVDKIVFHINSTNARETEILADAQAFVQGQSGQDIATILQNMLSMTKKADWQAGLNVIQPSHQGPQPLAAIE